MELFFKPLAHPAQCSAAQCVKHAANHDGKCNDERQHQERIAAAARQHAIIDLKQIDGRREKKEIVAAAIRRKRVRAIPRRPARPLSTASAAGDIVCSRSGGISIAVPASDLKSDPCRSVVRRLRWRSENRRPPPPVLCPSEAPISRALSCLNRRYGSTRGC